MGTLSDPTSAARWAVTGLLILALSALLALVCLWAEDVRAMRTVPRGWPRLTAAWGTLRGLPAAVGRAWLHLCCRASEARLLLTVKIGAHR